MRSQSFSVSILLAVLLAAVTGAQAPQPPAGDARFTGRWDLKIYPPGNDSGTFADGVSLAIVDIASSEGKLRGKLVASLFAETGGTGTIETLSVTGDELTLVLQVQEMGTSVAITLKGKRVKDQLELVGTSTSDPTGLRVVGHATTSDTVSLPTPKPPTPEQKAYSDANRKPKTQRVDALRQFLKDYPESKMKEQAEFQLAQSLETPEERVAALKKYAADYPKRADEGHLQIALVPTDNAEKTAALKRFLAEHPESRLRDRAAYELTRLAPTGDERVAAEEAFIKAYPTSTYGYSLFRTVLDSHLRKQPVDEARVAAILDAYIGAPPGSAQAPTGLTPAERASRMNNTADRMMVHGVMLDRALALITEALTTIGEKAPARTRALYTTTYGQVLYKRKDLAGAERELKRAIEIAGAEGEFEANLYLGKLYEDQQKNDAAVEAYLAADRISSNPESRSSLERAWTKTHGTVAGLEAKVDEAYLARKKPFEPGTFTRAKETDTGRVVLAELFTGAECGPCVAADLAFDGLGERYNRQTVAILEYHLHVPGPDPLSNPDTEARSKIYDVGGTPVVLVDGLDPQMGGGGEAGAGAVFKRIRDRVEKRLAVVPQASLTGFRATFRDGTMTVTGEAALAGAALEQKRKATVRVAVVQDSVRYIGSNGVRFHRFVVRQMLGPGGGFPMTSGPSSIVATVDVDTLVAGLEKYLTGYEKERAASRGSAFTFSSRVTAIQPSQLHIVAFVQDDESKEVLQAVVVPTPEMPVGASR